MPTKEDFEKYRFYQCYPIDTIKIKYVCIRQLFENDPIIENSRLLLVNKNIPRILDYVILKHKLKPSIKINY